MERFTRRRFISRAVLASGTVVPALLVACGPAAVPSPTPVAVKPTEAPQPAATTAPVVAASPTSVATTKPTEVPKPTAAAKPAKPKEPVTLRFHMRGGGEQSEPAIYVQRPKEWEEETGNKVKLEPIMGDYVGKLLALASGGTLGDITFTTELANAHSRFVKAGILQAVDDFLGPYNVKKTEWQKGIIDALTYDGKLFGLPKGGHPGDAYIWINLKMFDEAGIKRPETYGNTFDDVAVWASKLAKGPKDNREIYGYYVNVEGVQPITNAIRSRGGDVIDEKGLVSLADAEPWFEWARWNNQLMNVDRVHPFQQAMGGLDLAGIFAAGKLAMIHQQRSTERAVRLAVKDKFPYTTIQFPRGPQARGWAISINTHTGTTVSKHKEETFTLSYALADRRFAYLVAKEQGYLTGRVDNMEAIKELANDHFLQLQYKCEQEGEMMWRPRNLRAAEIETAIKNHMDLLWLGKRQLDKAFMGELKQSLDQILAKPE